eukprot:scaffold14930_cov33-Phaeocystis_antarctica.AAC.1
MVGARAQASTSLHLLRSANDCWCSTKPCLDRCAIAPSDKHMKGRGGPSAKQAEEHTHGSRASCSPPGTDSPKQRKTKPDVKERRLELAVQMADCGHDDSRGRLSSRGGSPVFILPLSRVDNYDRSLLRDHFN